MYINNLADIVNEYNNTYHSIVKMKRVDVISSTYFEFGIKIMIKILNLKLLIM